MDKTDYFSLTNQPEIVTITPTLSGSDTVFDELQLAEMD